MKRFINKIIQSMSLVCLLLLFSNSFSIFADESDSVIDTSLLDAKYDSNKLNVYFYDLGTHKNGDSYIITIGDVQILVDAGANEDSAPHIIHNM